VAEELNVLAHFVARDGRDAELRSLLESLIGPTRQEPGCMMYTLWAHDERPGAYTLVERWKSEEDLSSHLDMPYLQDAIARFEDLLSEPLRLEKYRTIS